MCVHISLAAATGAAVFAGGGAAREASHEAGGHQREHQHDGDCDPEPLVVVHEVALGGRLRGVRHVVVEAVVLGAHLEQHRESAVLLFEYFRCQFWPASIKSCVRTD